MRNAIKDAMQAAPFNLMNIPETVAIPGRFFNANGGAYRVDSIVGSLACFPGGRGVVQVKAERVADRSFTVREIDRLNNRETSKSID